MPTYRDARALARAQESRTHAVLRAAEKALAEGAELARKEAQRLTSGPHTAVSLNKSRAGRMRAANRLPIPQGSGKLKRSWRLVQVAAGQWQLSNTAHHAPFVLSPQFWQALAQRTRTRFRQLTHQYFQNAHRGQG